MSHKERVRVSRSHSVKTKVTAATTRKGQAESDRSADIEAVRRARLAYLETAPEERRPTMKYVYERPVKDKDRSKSKTETETVRSTKTRTRPTAATTAAATTTTTTKTKTKRKTRTRPSTSTAARQSKASAGTENNTDNDDADRGSDDGDYVYGRPDPSKDNKDGKDDKDDKAKARSSTSRRKTTSSRKTVAKTTPSTAKPKRRETAPVQPEAVVAAATPAPPTTRRSATSSRTRTATAAAAPASAPAPAPAPAPPAATPAVAVSAVSTATPTKSASTTSRKPPAGLSSLFHVAPPPPERRVSCLTCGDDEVRISKTARLPCRHRMCHTCLRRIFRLSITDPAHMPPRCCTDDHIALKHVDKLFDNEFKKTFNRKYVEYTANNRVYCVNRNCGQWIQPKEITTMEQGRKIGKCKKCGTLVCATCNTKAHRSRDCPKDPATRQFIETAKQKGWQKCYNCSAMVELKEGCNHMTCRCTAEFCMVCGLKWKSCDCAWFNYENIDAHLGNPLRYQQEMDRRREQERRDEALARRMQGLGVPGAAAAVAAATAAAAAAGGGGGGGAVDNGGPDDIINRDVFGLGNAAGHHMNANFIQQARDALAVNIQNAEQVARGLLTGWMGGRENPLPAGIPGTIEDELNGLLGPQPNNAAVAAAQDVNNNAAAAETPLQRRPTMNRRRRNNLRDDILLGRDPQEQAQAQEQAQEQEQERQRQRDQQRRIQDWANSVAAW